MTDDTPAGGVAQPTTPDELRATAAMLLRGAADDIEQSPLHLWTATPPEGQPFTDDRRTVAAGTWALGELISALTHIAMGLSHVGEDINDVPPLAPPLVQHGINLAAHSPKLRHLAHCPGHPEEQPS